MLGREVEKRAFEAKVQCFVENSAKKSLGRRQPFFMAVRLFALQM